MCDSLRSSLHILCDAGNDSLGTAQVAFLMADECANRTVAVCWHLGWGVPAQIAARCNGAGCVNGQPSLFACEKEFLALRGRRAVECSRATSVSHCENLRAIGRWVTHRTERVTCEDATFRMAIADACHFGRDFAGDRAVLDAVHRALNP
jgi:hypothetical protein